ncbi:ATP-binding cassette domain-containing protein [Roseofilum casamattae]|uniref:ATP-binding cassette domain-containing protein n=1 Tax=Roseofilum casamattae BLCC-M143 TaxID=3022442 RepID=A0ABT7BTV2_9CYAN|nr:ATP-binding cassette domain-containing protein [Roseofilum casamattae]MDJ1182608.1 ATP-binding cassette domain-containing protein [Roseofilum casamattae BLCC-M143]
MTYPIHNRHTLLAKDPELVLNNQGQTIAHQLKGDRHVLGRDRNLSDLAVPLDWDVISGCHATLEKVGLDYHIYDGDKRKASTNGLFINHTRIDSMMGYRLRDGDRLQVGQNPKSLITIVYSNSNAQWGAAQPIQYSLQLNQSPMAIGRDSQADLPLPSPIVSYRHAVIKPSQNSGYILEDYSTNGTFVNGQRVNGAIALSSGATIRIGPYSLVLQENTIVVGDRGDRIRLDAKNLILKVRDKQHKEKQILDNISLPIQPGQFVALVGGSGAGKSTLMKTLLGIQKPSQGEVYLNGENLRSNFNIYRNQIGYVPQDDIIHRDLTVREVLSYAAQLRLPSDIKPTERNVIIEETIQNIEMVEHIDKPITALSGGQRKRVSIGVELLADPKLFFLDEPTSGLDPGLDKNMMELLRKLADEGRTIILVTHATSNIKLCDRIVFLGEGGKLCYFGDPQDATSFFGVQDFPNIYNLLSNRERVIDRQQAFKTSQLYTDNIENILNQHNQKSQTKSPKKPRSRFLQQLTILSQRSGTLLIRDRANLALSLFTAPLGIILITFALGTQDPLILGTEDDPTLAALALRVLFVFTCAAIWVGLSSSLPEIIKEAAIYSRERLANLNLYSYLGSKLAILGGLTLAQTLLMATAILLCFQSPEPELLPWFLGMGITTFLTLFTCTNLGLMVSASVQNSSQANSALPLLLLPQIIFSGVLFKMSGVGQYISWLMLSRWSVGAYGILVDVNHMVPEPTLLPDGSQLPQPFEITSVYEPTWENLALNWGALCLHSLIYLGITWILQKKKDVL